MGTLKQWKNAFEMGIEELATMDKILLGFGMGLAAASLILSKWH